MDDRPVIEVRKLSKRYAIGPEGARRHSLREWLRRGDQKPAEQASTFWALKDLSFDIHEGERVGIIGRNGAGKSTLLKILSRVIYPTHGEAIIRGRVTSLLEVGTGFNNSATGRENIYLNASLHGLTRPEIDEKIKNIIAFSEIEKFIDTPIKHYSSGMRSRLAFSVAAHLDPDILILDEVLSVGDAAFQQKCLHRMKGLTSNGQTLIFVSHSMGSIMQFCSRGIWMEQGKIADDGPIEQVAANYLEATTSLQSSVNLETNTPSAQHDEADRSDTNKGLAAPLPEEVARLISACVINDQGDATSTTYADQNIRIRIVLDVLASNQSVEPALHVKDENQNISFVVAFTLPSHPKGINDTGRFSLDCFVPKNILNTGKYWINIHIVTPDNPVIRHCRHDDILSFFVHEAQNGSPSARGRYLVPRFPGAVRPLLDWEIKKVDALDPAIP